MIRIGFSGEVIAQSFQPLHVETKCLNSGSPCPAGRSRRFRAYELQKFSGSFKGSSTGSGSFKGNFKGSFPPRGLE